MLAAACYVDLPRLCSDCSDRGAKRIKNQLNSGCPATPTPHGRNASSSKSHADINHHLVQEIGCRQAIHCCSCTDSTRALNNTIRCISQPKWLYFITAATITTTHPDLTIYPSNNDNHKTNPPVLTSRNPTSQKHHPGPLRQIPDSLLPTSEYSITTNTLPFRLLQRNPVRPHCCQPHITSRMA